MKKVYLLWPTLLLVLTAEGAGFDRAALDGKLAELAASPAPAELAPGATRYTIIAMMPKAGEFICPVCGERTCYPDNAGFGAATAAEREAAELTGLGLDIAADVREFCRKCTPCGHNFREVQLPVKGVLLRAENNGTPAGTRLEIAVRNGDILVETEMWIYSALIGSDGQLLKNAQVRNGPGTSYASLDVYLKGRDVWAAGRRPDDPPDWTRLQGTVWHCKLENIGEIEYGTFFEADIPPEVWWEITVDGVKRRIKRRPDDAPMLRTLLRGETLYEGGRGEQYALKDALPRLRELVGTAK
ncbi:MAG: hypothetical protein PHI85_01430 [Victivallaceae bacterium]|nr:hypothetical protein [Victivallaceae bacterium]